MGRVHGQAIGMGRDFLEAEGGWHWREPRYADHVRTCSYCGCVNPEDLVREDSWRAEWADQKYGWPHKFYVTLRVPAHQAGLIVSRSSTHGPLDSKYASDRDRYVSIHDLTEEQVEVLIRDRSIRDREELERMRGETDRFHGYQFQAAGTTTLHHKFYTEHLNDERIPEDVRDQIQRRCGLVFEWLEDGRVRWYPYGYQN